MSILVSHNEMFWLDVMQMRRKFDDASDSHGGEKLPVYIVHVTAAAELSSFTIVSLRASLYYTIVSPLSGFLSW